jgi:hypothetical protein
MMDEGQNLNVNWAEMIFNEAFVIYFWGIGTI